MNKVAIIGPKYAIEAFSLIGWHALPCENVEKTKEQLDILRKSKDYSLVFITESLLEEVKNEAQGLNLIPLPDHFGTHNIARENISKLIKEAIGKSLN